MGLKRTLSRKNSANWKTTVPSKRYRESDSAADSAASAPTPAQLAPEPDPLTGSPQSEAASVVAPAAPAPDAPAPAAPAPDATAPAAPAPAAAASSVLAPDAPAPPASAPAAPASPVPAPPAPAPDATVPDSTVPADPVPVATTPAETALDAVAPVAEVPAPAAVPEAQISSANDDDDEDYEGIEAIKNIFQNLITILQLIPFFFLYIFLCGTVYKKNYPPKTIRSVGVSTISALFIGTLDDAGQFFASFREQNKTVREKRQRYARFVILLLILLFCLFLFGLAEPEPVRCNCVKKTANVTLTWAERYLACDLDFPYEMFGGLVAFIVFAQSSIRKMSSIPHFALLLISAAIHWLICNKVHGLPTSVPLIHVFAALCSVCCGILLYRTLPEDEKPKKEAGLYFSKLRKDWKLVILLGPFFALYLYLCAAVFKPDSPLKAIRSVGVSTISFLVFGTIDDLMQLFLLVAPSFDKLSYKRAVRCFILLVGIIACGYFYAHSSSEYNLYTCTCPEPPVTSESWSVEMTMVYEVFGALLAYSYVCESPVKDLPPVGHLPMLLLAFGFHMFCFDILDSSTTSPLSVFAAIICSIYFLILISSPLLKTSKFLASINPTQ